MSQKKVSHCKKNWDHNLQAGILETFWDANMPVLLRVIIAWERKSGIQKHLVSIRYITKVSLVMRKREKCWNSCLWLVGGQQHPLLSELECQKRTGKLWANVPGNGNVWSSFHIDRKQISVSCFPVSAVSRQDWVIVSLFCQQNGQLLGYLCHLLVKY